MMWFDAPQQATGRTCQQCTLYAESKLEREVMPRRIEWRFQRILSTVVISFTVSQSTHESGVRRYKAFAWLGGIMLGVVATLTLNRLFASMLYDETPTDITTIVILALLLSSVALMACYIPARRATKLMLLLHSDLSKI